MSDLIDRQAALDAVKQPHGGCYTEEAKGWAVYQILSVPSAEPERKTGHWIPILRDSENDEYLCSACSQPMGFDYDYCPHCGARMTSSPTYPSNSIN